MACKGRPSAARRHNQCGQANPLAGMERPERALVHFLGDLVPPERGLERTIPAATQLGFPVHRHNSTFTKLHTSRPRSGVETATIPRFPGVTAPRLNRTVSEPARNSTLGRYGRMIQVALQCRGRSADKVGRRWIAVRAEAAGERGDGPCHRRRSRMAKPSHRISSICTSWQAPYPPLLPR